MTVMQQIAPGGTLAEAIARVGTLYPEHGYTFQDNAGVERHYPFPELERATARRAAALQAMGLKKGDRLGLILTEPEDFILSFFGAVRVGIVPVPLYPPLALGDLDGYIDRLARILHTAGARELLVNEAFKHVLWSVVDRVEGLRRLTYIERVRDEGGTPDYPEITRDDLCFLQYTSGSTSDPKGVMVTHGSLEANVAGIMGDHGLRLDTEKDVAVSWLPLYHDMGLIGFVISPIYYAINTIHIPTLRFLKRPKVWLETLHARRGSVTFAPPFALPLVVRRATPADLERWDLSCLRIVGCGAEPISPEGVRQFVETFSTHTGMSPDVVLPAYGMAEATLAIALHTPSTPVRFKVVDGDAFQATGEALEAQEDASAPLEHVGCGSTFPGHEIGIFSETGERLDEGREGEVCFRGPSVMPGYFNNPQATADTFRGEWLRTGDLGYLLDREVFVTGRLKDLIICNGRNYHPQSIEWPIAMIDGVRPGNVVAFSRPGKETEEVVIALEKKPHATEALADAVRDVVRTELGLVVADVVLLEPGQLPKTSSGKLQRRKTRQAYLDGTLQRSGSRVAGSNADKITLARHVARSTWSRVKNRLLGR